MTRRARTAVAVTAALVVAGALALVLWTGDDDRPSACDRLEEPEAVRGPGSGSDVSFTVLGGSISAGTGLAPGDSTWVEHLAGHVAGTIPTSASDRTGFVSTGPCGQQSYADRVDGLVAEYPRTHLLVEGGFDDTGSSAAEVERAVTDLLEKLAAFDAPITVIGPVDAPAVDNEAAISRAVARACRAAEVQYVPLVQLDLDYQPDGVHLSATGQEQYANEIADVLTG